jgi:N-acetylmuramic acid 6-phosphate etherase
MRTTESLNKFSLDISQKTTEQILKLINDEDRKVANAVAKEIPRITAAVDGIVDRIKQGGRLIYIGAGTSGRLGILDASECPPTFGTDPELVQGLIAGGNSAVFQAVEGAEDDFNAGARDLQEKELSPMDSVVGLSASGRTPYVMGALRYARSINALSIGLACNEAPEISEECDILIAPVVGAEVVAGSTRMKAGTAEKLVLNMVSTTVMIKLCKIYQNMMVDMKPSNTKLVERAVRIVSSVTGLSEELAAQVLAKSDHNIRLAIIMAVLNCDRNTARQKLDQAGGRIDPYLNTPFEGVEPESDM